MTRFTAGRDDLDPAEQRGEEAERLERDDRRRDHGADPFANVVPLRFHGAERATVEVGEVARKVERLRSPDVVIAGMRQAAAAIDAEERRRSAMGHAERDALRSLTRSQARRAAAAVEREARRERMRDRARYCRDVALLVAAGYGVTTALAVLFAPK